MSRCASHASTDTYMHARSLFSRSESSNQTRAKIKPTRCTSGARCETGSGRNDGPLRKRKGRTQSRWRKEEGGKGREGTVGRRVGPACEHIWRPAASRASGSRTRTPSSKRTSNGHGHGDLCWADARVRALIEFKFTTAESRRLPDSLLPSVGPGSHRERAQREI